MATVTGNQGSVTFSAGSMANHAANVTFWSSRFEKKAYDITPMPRLNAPKFVLSSLEFAQGTVKFTVDDSLAAPVPSGSEVTLTLRYKEAATSRGYSFKAKLYGVTAERVQSNGGAVPVEYSGDWIRSDDTDTAMTVT